MAEPRFDARELNRRRRPRAAVVLSILGVLALSLVWLAIVASMVLVAVTRDMRSAMGWTVQAILVVVLAPVLWMWWRELLQPPVYPDPPGELDEPPRPNRALSGEDPPPARW